MLKYVLNVCLPTRDRLIATRKVVEALRENTKHFKEINIYVFDNLSNLDNNNRFQMFNNLIKNGSIQYYSYDTKKTTSYCFPKAIIFKRWINMMNQENKLEHLLQNSAQIKNFYLLIDSDMLVLPRWEESFITACENIQKPEPHTSYVIQLPGGTVKRSRDLAKKYKFNNVFSNSIIEVLSLNYGGGSGFWFMNLQMLNNLIWEDKLFLKVHNQYKKHDSTTWSMLSKKFKDKNYVCGIQQVNNRPYVITLGSVIGSTCNRLQNKDYNHVDEKNKNALINKPVNDLIKEHLNNGHCSQW